MELNLSSSFVIERVDEFFLFNNNSRFDFGIAKFKFCPSAYCPTETPINSPFTLRTGPPLLPGEIGAVI